MKAKIISLISSILMLFSPKLNTKFRYYLSFRKRLRLNNPITLDEKIQWLKFNTYYKNPLITKCADKFRVREYVKQCGCQNILNELYGAWDNVEDIPWKKLPNQFVIKWNFGCGQNLIVRDKSKLNIRETITLLNAWKKESKTFYKPYAEMQYKGIEPKLICEKLIDTPDHSLPLDYKVYCFNGVPKFVMLCTKRETGHPEYYFFDRESNLCRLNKRGLAASDNFSLQMPEGYDLLFKYAEKLTKEFPFVRADFYLDNGNIIFGELTFTPCGGMDPNIPPKQNEYLGSLVKLH